MYACKRKDTQTIIDIVALFNAIMNASKAIDAQLCTDS